MGNSTLNCFSGYWTYYTKKSLTVDMRLSQIDCKCQILHSTILLCHMFGVSKPNAMSAIDGRYGKKPYIWTLWIIERFGRLTSRLVVRHALNGSMVSINLLSPVAILSSSLPQAKLIATNMLFKVRLTYSFAESAHSKVGTNYPTHKLIELEITYTNKIKLNHSNTIGSDCLTNTTTLISCIDTANPRASTH